MGNLGNKEIFASNLKRYMKIKGKTATDISVDLNIPKASVSDWMNCRTYPRIDKIEMLANYFNIAKANLVDLPLDVDYTITLKGKNDEEIQILVELVNSVEGCSKAQIKSIINVINAMKGKNI